MPTLPNIEIFRTGTWKGRTYTDADLDGMAGAFDKLRAKLKFPVKLGHVKTPGAEAAGWISNLRKVGNKLVADLVDVPEQIAQAWREKRYRQVSSEIAGNFKDDGATYPQVLTGLALLGAELPAVTGLNPDHAASLPDVAACEVAAYTWDLATESGRIMERGDLFAAEDPPNDRKPGGLRHEENDMEKIAELTQKVAELTGQLAAAGTKIEQLTTDNGDLQTLTAERDQLKADADAAQKQLDELAAADRKRDAEAFLAKHTAEDSLRILPAQRKYAEAILAHADWTPTDGKVLTFTVDGEKDELTIREAFQKYVEALPDAGTKLFTELSKKGDGTDGGDADKSAEDKFIAEVETVQRTKDLRYEQAVDHVRAEKPELFAAYVAEQDEEEL